MTLLKRAAARPVTIWSRPFVFIFVINLIISMAQFMMNTLVPKLAESLGATAVVVGVVSGIFAVTALSVRPGVGPASVRFRKQHLLAATVGVLLLAFLIYAIADSIEMIIVARLLHGAGMGLLAPVTLALASDALPESRMASGIGIFSLGQAASTAIGPSIGLALLAHIGYQATFLCGAAVMGMALLLALRVKAVEYDAPPNRGFSWRTFVAPEAIVPAVVIFFLAGAYSGVNTFVVLYGDSLGIAEIGLFFTAYAVFVLISRPAAGRIADRFGLTTVIVPGMILFAVAFVVLSYARTLTGVLIAGAISAFGYGVCQPAIQTLSLTSVDKPRRAVAGNTNYIGVDLGYLVMPIIAGWVVSSVHADGATMADSYAVMYRVMVIPVVIGLVLYLVFGRSQRRTPVSQEPME
ncbi:MFS transporter [Demequina muriae]|uniref:MFS transporter n=1 Tax=Demequina muriae TaxID=3051664 RepID=A0ABT8GH22_9MICO|nr:MFS transporter [Demequina sp. EGI L300058]MDN4480559.1 MFS transporter [Demequina sp. EGI L300058]